MDDRTRQCLDFGRRLANRNAAARSSDVSGFAVFSDGGLGAAHVLAHDLLDAGRHHEGRRRLGAVLGGQTGSGSDWVHLQWHLAVFELATGSRRSPLRRFRRHILPAVPTGDALTDAPSLLWRLKLAGVALRDSDWTPVREVALANLRQTEDPYLEVHNLLALGIAGDVHGLDGWLEASEAPEHLPCYQIVRLIARGLRSLAQGDYLSSEKTLRRGARAVSWLGGSRGQNELFERLRDEAGRRVGSRPGRLEALVLELSA